MISLRINCKAKFRPRAEYVFATLFEIIGVSYTSDARTDNAANRDPEILINYGPPTAAEAESGRFVINIAEFDYDGFLDEGKEAQARFFVDSASSEKFAYFFRTDLTALGNPWHHEATAGHVVISHDACQINCAIDLVSTAFYLLGLDNEAIIGRRDELGRFQRHFCGPSDEAYDYPLADAFCSIIMRFLRHAAKVLDLPLVTKPLWPEGYKFALCLTHDIDRFNTWTFRKVLKVAKGIVKSGDGFRGIAGQLLRLPLSLLHPQNWTGNFGRIIDIESKYGFNSSFYFVARCEHSFDPSYSLDSSRLRRKLAFLRETGHEIGVHGGIHSAARPGYLKTEKERVENASGGEIKGGRQHFLRFIDPDTWRNIEHANLQYDSTLGFGASTGYRCGTSFPFRPFDKARNKAYDFYEVPLLVMDAALQKDVEHMALSRSGRSELQARLRQYMTWSRDLRGCCTLLWHNSDFDALNVTGYDCLYRDALHWAAEHEGWGCSIGEMVEWWVGGRSPTCAEPSDPVIASN